DQHWPGIRFSSPIKRRANMDKAQEDGFGAMGTVVWREGGTSGGSGAGARSGRSSCGSGERWGRTFGAGQCMSASAGTVGAGVGGGGSSDLSVALLGVQREDRTGRVSGA